MDARTGYGEVLSRVEKAAARCGRAGKVRLIAVSKAQSLARVKDAVQDGCSLFGENYAQELLEKAPQLEGVEWHFIGKLQTNKVKAVLPYVSLVHSVDRESLIEELARRAAALSRVQPILLEVNIGEEESKSGVALSGVSRLVEKVLERPSLHLRGLMAIPPLSLEPEEVRPYFKALRKLRDDLEREWKIELPELSMGMSADFEIAIEEGATLVRVGTALFGARVKRQVV